MSTFGPTEGEQDSVVVLGLPDEVVAVIAVATDVRQRVAVLYGFVGWEETGQVALTSALDTDDARRKVGHSSLRGRALLRMNEPITPATRDPENIPTLARLVIAGSSKASPATKRATVNPIPAMAARPIT